MTVDYYEINGCAFDMYCGRPAIFAPYGTAAELLANYGFSLLNDGRYVHFLDQQEYYHVMTQSGCERVVFDYSTWLTISRFYSTRRYELGLPVTNIQDRSANTTPNILCGISLGLFCFSVISILRSVSCFSSRSICSVASEIGTVRISPVLVCLISRPVG